MTISPGDRPAIANQDGLAKAGAAKTTGLIHMSGLDRSGPLPVELGVEEKSRLLAVDMPLELGRLVAWNARHEVQNRAGRTVPGYRMVRGVA